MKITKLQRTILSIIILLLIAFIDSLVTFEIASNFFYLVPILFFSYSNLYSRKQLILFALLTTALRVFVDFETHPYNNQVNFYVNILGRFLVFFFATLVVNGFYVEKEQRKIINQQKNELETVNKNLEQSNKELNKFIGVAAHDIRNPVGSIQMMAEMILDDKHLSDETRKWVAMVKTSAQSSLQILNDTLNISQIQSGTITLNKKKTDYIQFVKDNLETNVHLAQKKDQKVLFNSSSSSIEINIDQSRMTQVLNNLITNAIKYSEAGKEITVKVEMIGEANDIIKTHVIDNGLGIDEKFHAQLFDPFIITSNIPTGNESKTGLGLAIVKKIVELHDGTIDFTSEKGVGSDFFFTLPIE